MVAIDPSSKLGRADAALTEKPSHDPLRYWGYLLLLISFVLYTLEENLDINTEQNRFAVFFMHYFIAIAYSMMLAFNSSIGIKQSWKRESIHRTVVVLNLFLISAYALNREIPVFEQSTPWLCVYIVITSLALLSFAWYNRLPTFINIAQWFLLGSALTFYIYLAACCAGYFGIGAIGLIVFGIGAHVLVPVFLVICSIALIVHTRTDRTFTYSWLGFGSAFTIGVVTAFVSVWTSRINAMERVDTLSVLEPDAELPVWVRVAKSIKNDWISERILKSDLVYKVNNPFSWSWEPNSRAWTERRVHDPLVFIATSFRKSALSQEERIRILEAISDRHRAQERLWSGDNLETSNIVTVADIYPDLRLAYTEKFLSVRNDLHRGWNERQEAIYTFQLPEGSVVTSLSLWINGKEEKAILTSKQKASEAYTTIVGVESRDPSVVHWQEGNTITVRVFPCTPEEQRKFKLGITSPLIEENGRLHYKNISFRGPSTNGAEEVVRVKFARNPNGLILPDNFEPGGDGGFQRGQQYDPEWAISFVAPALRKNYFSFDGFTYSMDSPNPVNESRAFTELYLDINSTWSKDDLRALRPLIAQHEVFVDRNNSFVQLTTDNWSSLTAKLREENFSIFPFHHLRKPETSLVISKGEELSPFLADFKDSEFARGVASHFSQQQKANVFNLSKSSSTYIRSLRELRALNYTSGTAEDLVTLLDRKQFPVVEENESRIALHDAGVVITKTPTAANPPINNAPDHLARLFTYNDIMRQVGPQFFDDDFINDDLVKEASGAYVVSPVSSLIVLEQQQDYDRFGIEDSNNSLHNAMRLSSGAVPEPHEWALIALFAAVIMFCVLRQRSRIVVHSK